MTGVEVIIYIDYLLLGILVFLSVFAFVFCIFKVYQWRRRMTPTEVALRPTTVLLPRVLGEGGCRSIVTAVLPAPPPLPASPDSGVSAEYEPLTAGEEIAKVPADPTNDYSVNKTWNWNYKEYQI